MQRRRHMAHKPNVFTPGKIFRVKHAADHKFFPGCAASRLQKKLFERLLAIWRIGSEIRKISRILGARLDRPVKIRIDATVERHDAASSQAGLKPFKSASARITQNQIERLQTVRWNVVDRLFLLEAFERDRSIQIVKHSPGDSGIQNHVRSTNSIRAVRSDYGCFGGAQRFTHARLGVVPFGIQNQLVVIAILQIPVSSIVRDITFEERNIVPLSRESSAQTTPNRCVAVAPRSTDAQAENYQLHGELSQLTVRFLSRLPFSFCIRKKTTTSEFLRQAGSARGTSDQIQIAPNWNLAPNICDLNSENFVVGSKTSGRDQFEQLTTFGQMLTEVIQIVRTSATHSIASQIGYPGGRFADFGTMRLSYGRNAGAQYKTSAVLCMRWLSALLLIAGLTSLCAQTPSEQVSYEGQMVGSVELVADPRINLDAFRGLVEQKAGEPYSNQKVQASISALQKTERFNKVEVKVKPDPAGLQVSFVLETAFYIGVLQFPGAVKAFSYTRLLQVANLPDENLYDKAQIPKSEAALLKFFEDNGYFRATVQADTQLNEPNQLANITFNVNLGKRARIGQVQIQGPAPQENARLLHSVRSLRAMLTRSSLKTGRPYSPARIQAATRLLKKHLAAEHRLASVVQVMPPQYHQEHNR